MVSGLRSLAAAVALLLISRRIPRLTARIEWLGALFYAATVLSFVFATKLGTAANAIFLQSTAPFHVALLGHFLLRQRLRVWDYPTLALIFVGMLLFFGRDISLDQFQANALGLFSGLTFAGFILCMRVSPRKNTSLAFIIWGNVFAFLLTLPFFPHFTLDASAFTLLATLGVFQLALPYFLYSIAAPHVGALETSLIFLLEPLLNPIWVYWAMGEKIGPTVFVGGGLIVVALLIQSVLPAGDSKIESEPPTIRE